MNLTLHVPTAETPLNGNRLGSTDLAGTGVGVQIKALSADFAFQPQIYRADGEQVRLPAGAYTVEYTRGPSICPASTRSP